MHVKLMVYLILNGLYNEKQEQIKTNKKTN